MSSGSAAIHAERERRNTTTGISPGLASRSACASHAQIAAVSRRRTSIWTPSGPSAMSPRSTASARRTSVSRRSSRARAGFARPLARRAALAALAGAHGAASTGHVHGGQSSPAAPIGPRPPALGTVVDEPVALARGPRTNRRSGSRAAGRARRARTAPRRARRAESAAGPQSSRVAVYVQVAALGPGRVELGGVPYRGPVRAPETRRSAIRPSAAVPLQPEPGRESTRSPSPPRSATVGVARSRRRLPTS